MNTPFDLQALIARHRAWPDMTAYDRAKVICRGYVEAGHSVPAWSSLREVIGKGSSGDINRAKDDFRREMADQMRAILAMPDGVPAALSSVVLSFWQEALRHAGGTFDKERAAFQEALSQAQDERERMAADLLAANRNCDAALMQIASLSTALEAANRQTHEADKTASAAQAALGLKDQMYQDAMARLLETQTEVSAAVTRLEGVENHALMRIEEAREAAKREVATKQQRYDRDRQNWQLEAARYQRRLSEIEVSAREEKTQLLKVQQLLEAKITELEATVLMAADKKPRLTRRPVDRRR